jgi:hypothetical protein
MASRNIPLPYFPSPPQTYSPHFFAEFLRAFSLYMAQVQNPGEARATTIVLTNLATDDVGLEEGTVFQVDGFLKVSILSRPHVASSVMTVSVGTVSVVV